MSTFPEEFGSEWSPEMDSAVERERARIWLVPPAPERWSSLCVTLRHPDSRPWLGSLGAGLVLLALGVGGILRLVSQEGNSPPASFYVHLSIVLILLAEVLLALGVERLYRAVWRERMARALSRWAAPPEGERGRGTSS